MMTETDIQRIGPRYRFPVENKDVTSIDVFPDGDIHEGGDVCINVYVEFNNRTQVYYEDGDENPYDFVQVELTPAQAETMIKALQAALADVRE